MAKKDGKKKEQDDTLNGVTPVGVACFVHVWEPHAFEGKDPNFGLILCFKADEDVTALKQLAARAAKKKWGADAKKVVNSSKWRWPWRDASEYSEYGAPFDDDDYGIMINLKSRAAPGVVDARARPITKQTDFYAGCLARASIYAHAYDNSGNRGVTFLLNNVQKAGDGDNLAGGRRDPTEDFDALVEDDGDDIEDLL